MFEDFEEGCPACGYWQCKGDCGENGNYVPQYLEEEE